MRELVLNGVEIFEEECPKCGRLLLIKECDDIGCDNRLVIDNDDEFWEVEIFICSECQDTGWQKWCKNSHSNR